MPIRGPQVRGVGQPERVDHVRVHVGRTSVQGLNGHSAVDHEYGVEVCITAIIERAEDHHIAQAVARNNIRAAQAVEEGG